MSFKRETLEDGSVRLSSARCSYYTYAPAGGGKAAGRDAGVMGPRAGMTLGQQRPLQPWFQDHAEGPCLIVQ